MIVVPRRTHHLPTSSGWMTSRRSARSPPTPGSRRAASRPGSQTARSRRRCAPTWPPRATRCRRRSRSPASSRRAKAAFATRRRQPSSSTTTGAWSRPASNRSPSTRSRWRASRPTSSGATGPRRVEEILAWAPYALAPAEVAELRGIEIDQARSELERVGRDVHRRARTTATGSVNPDRASLAAPLPSRVEPNSQDPLSRKGVKCTTTNCLFLSSGPGRG